jgi:mono/diheme cytochrome c family protein
MVSILADTPTRGELVFKAKGCTACHSLESRPSRGGRRVSLADFAERMWNHESAIEAAGRRGAVPSRLTGQDMAVLVGHFFASRYFDTGRGDSRRGQTLVRTKGCLSCHTVYGRGGDLAPDFATSNVVSSVEGQLAAMWNHGRLMSTKARRQREPLRELTGQEIADIATYLSGVAKGPVRSR